MAQALQAASATVDPDFVAHSLRAYFIRRGRPHRARPLRGRPHPQRPLVLHPPGGGPPVGRRHLEPGGVVPGARAGGRHRDGFAAARICPAPTHWPRTPGARCSSAASSRRRPWTSPAGRAPGGPRPGCGSPRTWATTRCATRAASPTCPTTCPPTPWCGPIRSGASPRRCSTRSSSRPASTTPSGSTARMRADRWHLHDFTCQTFVGGRGLSTGHVFDEAGTPRGHHRPGGAPARRPPPLTLLLGSGVDPVGHGDHHGRRNGWETVRRGSGRARPGGS